MKTTLNKSIDISFYNFWDSSQWDLDEKKVIISWAFELREKNDYVQFEIIITRIEFDYQLKKSNNYQIGESYSLCVEPGDGWKINVDTSKICARSVISPKEIEIDKKKKTIEIEF